jgi:endoglucanase
MSDGVRRLLIVLFCPMSSCLLEASPKIEFLGMAAPDVIEVVVQAGRVDVGRQIPYVKQDGDVIEEREHRRTLYRNGKKIGVVIGPDGDILRPFDTFTGEPLDAKWADNKASYRIESATDVRYRQQLGPVEVHRKSKPTGIARTDDWKFKAPVEHHRLEESRAKPGRVGLR